MYRQKEMLAFNTNAIVYDNTPWRPGRDIDVEHRNDDQRKLKNLATRVMSNGVEVLVRDKSSDGKQEKRKLKVMSLPSSKSFNIRVSSTPPNKSLLSSATATIINKQHMSALFPLHQLMQHNYIIKTCMTTYTYLTTVVQNKRSAISTFETIVSVVTTESLTNLYATDVVADLKPTKTKYMEVKTIQPSVASNIFLNNIPKIDKRIDSEQENFDIIQPSEINHGSCTTSCSCSHTRTEMLKTKYTNNKQSSILSSEKYNSKSTKFSGTSTKTTHKNVIESTLYHPYEYESSSQAPPPTDRIVEKYTQVNDFSDEKDSNSVENSDLLTNEQAPLPTKINKTPTNKTSEKIKPDKPQKINKNKFVVAELIKLGSLGIKGLSQLAPVIEKMTGGFMKRQEINKTSPSSSTINPSTKVTSYNANKRVDNDIESKIGSFPIYIPVDEMEASESQIGLTNVTLHQNFAWAAEHNNPISHLIRPKIVHESPLVNGGIPISPGEIITANSDVIVGKPAVGGPLTLVASGIKLQNNVHPPLIDNVVANNELYITKEKPLNDKPIVDDSFDLRPPEMPKSKPKLNKNVRPQGSYTHTDNFNQHPGSSRLPPNTNAKHEYNTQSGFIKANTPKLVNHGRPAFFDYIPPLSKLPVLKEPQLIYRHEQSKDQDIPDNSPSSSEIVSTKITTDGEYSDTFNKPLLVDIQPSRVANVLIPHGSSTALVFAGSSEPHKTGDYVDDPLPYPEPGYFGSFSIDAPQMTNVHNVVPNKNQFLVQSTVSTTGKTKSPFSYKESNGHNVGKVKWNDNKHPADFTKIPPPTSNQETYVRVGPQITAYNPEIYKELEKHLREKKVSSNLKEGKGNIDKEYENYLAVPPLPPQLQFKPSSPHNKNKYHQQPIAHTKPAVDSNVFINIQHPVPNQLPPKVTSEIYFASQMTNSYPTPTYTINMPPPTIIEGSHSNLPLNPSNQLKKTSNTLVSSKTENKSNLPINNREHTYTVTLNTATNVASDSATGHIVGSSISVPITTTSLNGQINADIPIGTNFAIRVEDDPTKYESVALHGKRHPSLIHEDEGHMSHSYIDSYDHKISDGSANATSIFANQVDNNQKNIITNKLANKNDIHPPILNSHANFPIINEDFDKHQNSKPSYPFSIPNMNIKPKVDERPSHFLPNISTNSHGWYASVLNEENLKNMKLEVTTRKIIPLKYDTNSYNLPKFGEKMATVGKPPTEFWDQNNKRPINNFNVGKPFSKGSEIQNSDITSINVKQNYIPSILNNGQKVYDIPTKATSYEKSSINSSYLLPTKTIYETADEIFDGEDGSEDTEFDSEVSSESMKVPIIMSSLKIQNISKNSFPNITANTYKKNQDVQLVNYSSGGQTEKPFATQNRTSFHSNNIKPIYDQNIYTKPRPFTPNLSNLPLDHQLQQPHWQINQLMENYTNISYEDNMDLNIGEEMYTSSTSRPITTRRPSELKDTELSYNKHQKPFSSNFKNSTKFGNGSNIITSTVHIQDKKPLLIEVNEKTTMPVFTIKDDIELNISSSEIIDLSPPPPIIDDNYKFKLTTMQEIMGMSPPPPRTSPPKYTSRVPATSRPILPIRTSPPYRTLPPRTLQSKQTTQRPPRKPISKDDVSTYRPTFDIVNKMKRPYINRDQPSSNLLPPPRDILSVIASIDNMSMQISNASPTTNVIFPTPVSTSWLVPSNIEFPTNAYDLPSSIYFPDAKIPSETLEPDIILENSSENIYNSNEYETSSEVMNVSYEKPITQKTLTVSTHFNKTRLSIDKELGNTSVTEAESIERENISSETSQNNVIKERLKVTIGSKIRTRKPYPIRSDDKKTVTNRFKPPSKIIPIIKPTRTLSRSEITHPTRITSIKKNIRPVPSRPLSFIPTSIIESSESSLEEDYIRPTEVLNENQTSILLPMLPSVIERTITSTLTISQDINEKSNIHKTHYSGNEIKISDEIIPTKTEFKTTIITLTKTLSEPPQIISSIGYVNLTHTLTVTHTETSLVSQSEGAITETLVLTNIHTSTIVDVVTEVYTQVQPTTIVETVTKHVPIPQVEATPVLSSTSITKIALDDISMSSEERDNFIIRDEESNATENIQKIDVNEEKDNDTFFVVMNKSQNGGKSPPVTDIDTGDYDGITRNEQVNSNGVSQVLFGEILLAGTPYSETTNVGHPIGAGYGKECQPDCKASRNERCQRIDGVMKCVCRPGFARMFPDRPCKPTYTYSVRLALGSQGKERLKFHSSLSNNSTKEYHSLAVATHEGINRMIMQSDLRDVYHGVHISGFYPIDISTPRGDPYTGVINDFYVQLSDNAHESRLKEVIEKYLRNNNYSLGGTEVHAAEGLMDRLNVSDFDECISRQFHDCSEHAMCFNLRGTYTCSCLEGFADLSVNTLYPGRICSSDTVGCGGCNYHGTCFERESAMICECFKWYAGRTCQVNLKAVLITVTVVGAVIILAVSIWASKRCCSPKNPTTQTFVIGCMQGMPSIHQGNMPSKQRADRRALIAERMETAETSSVQNTSLPYIPAKSRSRSSCSKKITVISDPPAHAPPPPPAPALMIPRARLHPLHSDSRDNLSRKKSTEVCSEAKLISYLESGVTNPAEEMRRKHSMESSYSINKERSGKQGALVSAGFKVSTTIRPDDSVKEDRDDASSVNKTDLEDASRFDTLRKTYSQEDMSEWTDAERRIGELTLSEARSVGGTLPASTGRAASSTRLTHQEANTMAERDLGSTFLLPHVHLYKPDLTSDVSEFDSL